MRFGDFKLQIANCKFQTVWVGIVLSLAPGAADCFAQRVVRPMPPATLFEPLPLTRARQEEQRAQQEVQRAADKDAGDKEAVAKAAAAKAAVEKAAEAKAAAAKAAAAERDAAQNAQVQQYVQLLTPTMWTELEFVRQTCELTPEQRPKIKAAAEDAMKQAAREIGMPQAAVARAVAAVIRPARPRSQTGASQTIRAALSAAIKETVAPAEFEKYSLEATQRAAHRKEAAILGAVARLDSLLCLNAEQREKMVESLNAGWLDDWEQWIQLARYGGHYFPQIPDKHVLPLLNDEQKSVWSGVQKISVNSWGGDNGRARDVAWWEGKQ